MASANAGPASLGQVAAQSASAKKKATGLSTGGFQGYISFRYQ
jgi:hypothetical protein